MRYLVIYEQTETGISAYVPDLPGCIATGTDKSEAFQHLKEAVELHIEGMKEEGLPIPLPSTQSDLLEVA
jgi:predicted RNase H-like HicB family nuclease